MKEISIRTRLIITLTLILLLSFAATNYLSYYLTREAIREDTIHEDLPLISDNIYSEFQRDLMRPLFVSSLMAHDTFLKDWVLNGEADEEKIRKYLNEIKIKYNFDTSFFISGITRTYYYYGGINKKISESDPHDVWYWNFLDLNVDYDLDVDTDQTANNLLTVFINHRLNSYDGTFLGVVGVGLRMAMVGDLFSNYRQKYDKNIYLVDGQGIIQVHSNLDSVIKTNIYKQEGLEKAAADILSQKSENAAYKYEQGGRTMLLMVRYIPEFKWYLFVEEDEAVSLKNIKSNLVGTLAIGLTATIIIIAICIFTVNIFQKKLEIMAVTDKLTGAYNRREFEDLIKRVFSLNTQKSKPFSLILIDIDNFKNINDTYGHPVGDQVIQSVADTIRTCIRQNDALVRWGGDEFTILTAGNMQSAATIAERIRGAACEITIRGDQKNTVTVSCGVAELQADDDKESLIARADKALYQAKDQGRDRVVCL